MTSLNGKKSDMISVYIGCDFFLLVFRNDYRILRGSEVKLTDIYLFAWLPTYSSVFKQF